MLLAAGRQGTTTVRISGGITGSVARWPSPRQNLFTFRAAVNVDECLEEIKLSARIYIRYASNHPYANTFVYSIIVFFQPSLTVSVLS